MIPLLYPLALRLAGPRFAKALSWGIMALAIATALYGAYSWAYGRGANDERALWEAKVTAIRRERDKAMERAVKADQELMARGLLSITQNRKGIDDATKYLPDKSLSDRQRARACAELRRTGRGCQPSAFTPASNR